MHSVMIAIAYTVATIASWTEKNLIYGAKWAGYYTDSHILYFTI